MKKILISMVCIMMMGIQSVNAQIGIAVLHHQGISSVFEEYSVAEAITAAVDGDTLYLSEGHFKGGVTINKAIHVIGSGQGTLIDGDITISFENNPTLSGYLLTGLYVKGDIVVNKAVKGLGISQCRFNNFGKSSGSSASSFKVTELYIERCYCSGTVYLNPVEGGSFYGCQIANIDSHYTTGQSSFNHCNISYVGNFQDSSCFFLNCIYTYTDSRTSELSNNVWQNCLLCKTPPSTCEHCWSNTSAGNLTIAELESKGYIATDGTVVGYFGGETPYTLELATPKVVEHNIEVDKANKKLNVTLTVGNE